MLCALLFASTIVVAVVDVYVDVMAVNTIVVVVAVVSVAAEAEDSLGLVVLKAAGGADGEGELGAEVDGGVDGLEAAQPEDEAAVLDAEVEGERGRRVQVRAGEGWSEVRRGCAVGGPGQVGGSGGGVGWARGALEEGGGFA